MPERYLAPHWRTAPHLMATIGSSVAALGSLCSTVRTIRPPYGSRSAALRSDWLRIGADFGVAIEREKARLQTVA